MLRVKINHYRRDIGLLRGMGGIGDLVMHRGLFAPLKAAYPESRLIVAVPFEFAPLVTHPLVDRVVDYHAVRGRDFLRAWDTSNVANRYEKLNPHTALHRVEIWARHCGIELGEVDLSLTVPESDREAVRDMLPEGYVALCPRSAQSRKNLTPWQLATVLDALKGRQVIALHWHDIPELSVRGIKVISNLKLPQYMAALSLAAGVVSVDTAAFHLAGAMGIPQVCIFNDTNGAVYSRYYKECHALNKPVSVRAITEALESLV